MLEVCISCLIFILKCTLHSVMGYRYVPGVMLDAGVAEIDRVKAHVS